MKSLKESLFDQDFNQDDIEMINIMEYLKKHYKIRNIDSWVNIDADNRIIDVRCNVTHKRSSPDDRLLPKGWRFGKVEGDFWCGSSKIKTLEGAPEIVEGDFTCDENRYLESLEGAPDKVEGDFSCMSCNSLKNLKGISSYIDGILYCNDCIGLESLEGAENTKLYGHFICNLCNSLKTLKGAPKKIFGSFYCIMCTSLESLEGGPDIVDGDFNCGGCTELKSLKGAPKAKKYYTEGCSNIDRESYKYINQN